MNSGLKKYCGNAQAQGGCTGIGLPGKNPQEKILVLVFCVLWRNVNLEQAFLWRNLLVWLFALPVLLGGICQWLFACKKKPA